MKDQQAKKHKLTDRRVSCLGLLSSRSTCPSLIGKQNEDAVLLALLGYIDKLCTGILKVMLPSRCSTHSSRASCWKTEFSKARLKRMGWVTRLPSLCEPVPHIPLQDVLQGDWRCFTRSGRSSGSRVASTWKPRPPTGMYFLYMRCAAQCEVKWACCTHHALRQESG